MSIQNRRILASGQWNVAGGVRPEPPERRRYRKCSPRRPRRSRTAKVGLLVVTFAMLVGALCITLWRQEAVPPPHKVQHTRILRTAVGPFLVAPLSKKQVDALRSREISNVISYKRLARMYVSHMTLDEELGQLFMVEYYDTSYSPALNTMITKLHAGGVVMYAFQMRSFAQTKHDISEMQGQAKLPLFISADEEGGFVERIQHIYGHRPGALETYLTGKPEKAAQLGQSIAHDLHMLGINEDLAPDVDVQLVNGPDQYLRTWGYTPQSVITYAGAYMRGLQGKDVIACIKHFPGLGAAKTDAHFDLPIINRTRDQLAAVELAPFKAFIQSQRLLEQPGMIMPTDVLMPAIDPVWPAELSRKFITDILRNQLGYDGVVITDALYMKGIADHWSLPQAAVLSLQAGNDMLLGANGPDQMQAMLNGLKAALRTGQLSKARIDEAAIHIITLKLERKLITSPL